VRGIPTATGNLKIPGHSCGRGNQQSQNGSRCALNLELEARNRTRSSNRPMQVANHCRLMASTIDIHPGVNRMIAKSEAWRSELGLSIVSKVKVFGKMAPAQNSEPTIHRCKRWPVTASAGFGKDLREDGRWSIATTLRNLRAPPDEKDQTH